MLTTNLKGNITLVSICLSASLYLVSILNMQMNQEKSKWLYGFMMLYMM